MVIKGLALSLMTTVSNEPTLGECLIIPIKVFSKGTSLNASMRKVFMSSLEVTLSIGVNRISPFGTLYCLGWELSRS